MWPSIIVRVFLSKFRGTHALEGVSLKGKLFITVLFIRLFVFILPDGETTYCYEH